MALGVITIISLFKKSQKMANMKFKLCYYLSASNIDVHNI